MRLALPPGHVIVPLPKAVLVLTEVEYLRGLRRGKARRRREALERRTEGENVKPEAPGKADRHAEF